MHKLICWAFIFCVLHSFGQIEDGIGMTSLELKYDNSYISPTLRAKNSISLGFVNTQTTPDQSLDVTNSWHVGYNYLILNQRKLKLSLKDRNRTEMRALGLHFTYVRAQEYYLMATFFNPIIAKKGRFFSFYFFSEVGLGYHYKKDLVDLTHKTFKYHVSLDALRIRFGKMPLYFHITGTYAISNKLFKTEPMEIGYLAGFRYYFYKK